MIVFEKMIVSKICWGRGRRRGRRRIRSRIRSRSRRAGLGPAWSRLGAG
jgi:hypothetical protein